MKLYFNDKLISDNLISAESFLQKLQGLMFKKKLKQNQCLKFKNCNWIHTFFMRFSIDVIYFNSKNIVVDTQSFVKPWRFCKPRLKAKHLIEAEAGFLFNHKVNVGGVLRCSDS